MFKNKKETVVFLAFFALCITLLLISVIVEFNYLDLVYLLFLVGCLIRYIYIKVTN